MIPRRNSEDSDELSSTKSLSDISEVVLCGAWVAALVASFGARSPSFGSEVVELANDGRLELAAEP